MANPPASILIIGSGVFGLSTAWSLTQDPHFLKSKITLLDRAAFPAPDGSSIDSSRIVRADYPDAAYARLAAEAQQKWRGEFGAEGRYTECGLSIFSGDLTDAASSTAEQGASQQHAERSVQKSMRNVIEGLGLRVGRREEGGQATPFTDAEGAREAMGNLGGLAGTQGYVNWTSGWAHAENGMRFMRQRVEATGRVEFRQAEMEGLVFREDRKDVRGVQLVGGEQILADLTVLATGAWTPKFLDLRGIASSTGQALAYLDITEEEQERFSKNPVVICYESGMFIIPPYEKVLKVARHGYGYANPTTIPNPEDPATSITVSLPRTKHDDPNLGLAPEGLAACRSFLAKCIPDLADRPFTYSRICWYTDTESGDFLITYHPRYPSLFVATGGSGHGYKFLPVIGDRIVDVVRGVDRDDLGAELRKKWAWPKEKFAGGDHIWTEDRRGGRKGMILDEELKRTDV